MPRDDVPWYRWEFNIPVLLVAGFFVFLAVGALGSLGANPPVHLSIAAISFALAVWLLREEWRHRKGIRSLLRDLRQRRQREADHR